MSSDRCNKFVYWWDGEYEGECRLVEGHKGAHWDGMSWFNDDNEEVTPPTFDDLVKWVRQQIEDDEADAKGSPPGPVARWNPARVLVECEVKRKMIAFALDDETDLAAANSSIEGEWGADMDLPETVLRMLAAAYDDRLGYWEGWRL